MARPEERTDLVGPLTRSLTLCFAFTHPISPLRNCLLVSRGMNIASHVSGKSQFISKMSFEANGVQPIFVLVIASKEGSTVMER